MPSQVNGRPLDPTARRSPAGERVVGDEVAGAVGAGSIGDLTDVEDGVSPDLGTILSGDGSEFQAFDAGADGTFIGYDAAAPQGLVSIDHEALDTLTHALAENAFEEYLYTGKDLTSVIVWTNNTKVAKIRETTLSYTGKDLTGVVIEQYAADGSTVLTTLTKTLAYTGKDLSSVTVVRS